MQWRLKELFKNVLDRVKLYFNCYDFLCNCIMNIVKVIIFHNDFIIELKKCHFTKNVKYIIFLSTVQYAYQRWTFEHMLVVWKLVFTI